MPNSRVSMLAEITIAPVTSENGTGEKGTKPKSAPVGAVIAIRRGPIDEDGAHFATAGNSTYFDEDAVGNGAEKYDLSSANVADTSDPKTTLAILHEAAKDGRLTSDEHERVDRLIADAEKGEPYISYLENEELPLPDAAKRLGYDGIKVWENDDVGNPSSVFLWNTDKAKNLSKSSTPAGDYVHYTNPEAAAQIRREGFDLSKYGSGIGPKREINLRGISVTRDAGVSAAYEKHGLQGVAVKAVPKNTLDLSTISVPSDEIIHSGAYGREQESRESVSRLLEDRGSRDLADRVDSGENVQIPGDVDPDNALLKALRFPPGANVSGEKLTEVAKKAGYDSVAYRDELLALDPKILSIDEPSTPGNIEMVAKEVRAQLLGNKAAEWKDCTPVSYALADRLKGEYRDVAVVSGDYGTTQHNWVVVPSKNLYIDATHDQFGSNAIRAGHLTDEGYKRDYSPDPQDIWVKANSAEFPAILKTALAESGGLSQN